MLSQFNWIINLLIKKNYIYIEAILISCTVLCNKMHGLTQLQPARLWWCDHSCIAWPVTRLKPSICFATLAPMYSHAIGAVHKVCTYLGGQAKSVLVCMGGGGFKHKKYICTKNIGTKTRLLFVLWKTESKISNLLYLEIYLNLMLKYIGITGIEYYKVWLAIITKFLVVGPFEKNPKTCDLWHSWQCDLIFSFPGGGRGCKSVHTLGVRKSTRCNRGFRISNFFAYILYGRPHIK